MATQRDIVLRLSLELAKAALPGIDTSQAERSLEAIETRAQSAGERARQTLDQQVAAAKQQAGAVAEALSQGGGSRNARSLYQQLAAAQQELVRRNQELDRSLDQVIDAYGSPEFEAAEKQYEDLTRAVEQQKRAVEELENRIAQTPGGQRNLREQARAYDDIAGGTLDLVRAVALLGASQSSTARDILAGVVAIEGFATAGRAAARVAQGLAGSYAVLKATTLGYTASQTAAAVATARLTVAMVASRAAAIALQFALGPIGLALIALGGAYLYLRREQQAALVSEEEYVRQKEVLESRQRESARRVLDGVREQNRLEAIRRRNRLDRSGAADLDAELAEATRRARVDAANARLAANDPILSDAAEERALNSARRLEEVQSEIRDRIREQGRERERSLRLEQREVQTAQRILEAEQRRRQAITERLGLLGPEARGFLRRVSGILQGGGNLNRFQVQRAQQLLGATPVLRQQAANLAGDLPAELRPLIGSGITPGQQDQIDAAGLGDGTIAQQLARANEAQVRLETEITRNAETTAAATEAIVEQIRVTTDRIADLTEELSKLRAGA